MLFRGSASILAYYQRTQISIWKCVVHVGLCLFNFHLQLTKSKIWSLRSWPLAKIKFQNGTWREDGWESFCRLKGMNYFPLSHIMSMHEYAHRHMQADCAYQKCSPTTLHLELIWYSMILTTSWRNQVLAHTLSLLWMRIIMISVNGCGQYYHSKTTVRKTHKRSGRAGSRRNTK